MKWLTLVAVLVGALAVGLAAERAAIPAGRSGRSVSVAKNGMVATSHPLAVQVGLDVLKQGGNAVDAAIAANAAIGLMEPMSCGIGGDLFALVWDAKTQRLYGLNASGRAPKRATRQWFVERGYKEIPTTGPLSWSVPGCVDGWEELRRRFGTKSLAELLEPSIRYAEDGFPVPEVIAGYWRGAEKLLAKTPEASKTFMQDGRAPRAGELFRNPYLARTYRELAANGRETFYRGRIAREIVAYSERVGGLFSIQDFEEHTSTWVEPVSTTYRGYHVWQLPPPGQGIAVLQILNLLEPYDLKRFGPNSPDWWHLFIEAKKLAYADRARYYADPQFAKVPVAELISKPYAERRRQLIRLDKALTDVPAGDPKLAAGDTIYLCVVDKDRNCVSLIQSNYHSFGSGLVPGELGFALQNRGTLLSLDEQHANRLEPGKRPFHTIIPALVTKDGRPFFVFGVMGGDMQPQGQVQVLVNLLDFGMDVQAAGEAPRIEHVGSPTPTGRLGDPRGGVVLAEPGIPESVVEELKRRGHEVRRVSRNGGGYQGILIDWDNGTLLGGSEYRKDGYAAGY
ncbi:MAG: gamma-glutamyltransferase [Gemmatales bacterium]|nr:gamma-glutamyltransferase [Gemmatales bacterium]MDW8176805.1 gamma-glutamyltransferase [Gemmatales bacterium]